VDADAHHYELESWSEIVDYIEDPIVRYDAKGGGALRLSGASTGRIIPGGLGSQDLSGRLVRYPMRALEVPELRGAQRDVELIKRSMEAMGIDYQILFPTSMLGLSAHPQVEVEVAVARAYARWITERILAGNPQLRTLLYLPLNHPKECLRLVEDFAEAPGVVGFMITTSSYAQSHHNDLAPAFRAIEERGLPVAFHANYRWIGDRAMESLNSFTSVHALGFPFSHMVHMSNWVLNGMPERFPKLKAVWVEGGLAWLTFLMQRLDHEYLMRTSEAPLLTRKPSEYMREMYFTSQPLESACDMGLLEKTFELIDAENRLLYASDYPHWDFDLPSRIYDLPFLSEQVKRRILSENACQLFGLPPVPARGTVRNGQ
jgi:predicted TIM-barrel fold metal-dependent hydrolase